MPTGQTFQRMDVYTDNAPVSQIMQIAVFVKPMGVAVSAREINETQWPGLEASCEAAFGADLWAAIKALDPIPPPPEEMQGGEES